jgi:hypothetical protein
MHTPFSKGNEDEMAGEEKFIEEANGRWDATVATGTISTDPDMTRRILLKLDLRYAFRHRG